MEYQELTAEKAPFLDRGEVLKCKYNALAIIIVNSIFSIFLATRFAILWSQPAVVRKEIIGPDHFHVEVILFVVLIVLLTPVSYFSAWRLSRRLTSDPASRKSIMWSIQLAMHSVVSLVNILLLSVLMFGPRFY